ncbi:MAG: hypothetical protein KKF56_05665 [Nanoarchaeota archaeon]|nr:hypothetical protein [Nanoarchaeota archaeon]
MKWRALLLTLMLGWEFWVFLDEAFGYTIPIKPEFPMLGGLITAQLFWAVFMAITVFLALTLIWSGVSVKNKTYIENKIIMPETKEVKEDE